MVHGEHIARCAHCSLQSKWMLCTFITSIPSYHLWRNGLVATRAWQWCRRCITFECFAPTECCWIDAECVSLVCTTSNLSAQWAKDVELFIALTDFARVKFIVAGLPAEQIVVKPNFVFQKSAPAYATQKGAIFIGRLKYEKGVDILLDAWRQLPQVPLHIYGSGPEAEKIVAMKETDHQLPSVQLHGQKSQAECQEALAQFQFLVMASRLYEGFPRVIVEAYSCGRPVVVPRLGGMAAAVEEGVTGLLFRPGDANDLADKVRWLTAHPDEIARMGVNALIAYHARYSPEVNRDQLLAIYERAMTYSKGQPFIRSVTVPS